MRTNTRQSHPRVTVLAACSAVLTLLGCGAEDPSESSDAVDTAPTTPAGASPTTTPGSIMSGTTGNSEEELLQFLPGVAREWPVSRPGSCGELGAVEDHMSVVVVPDIDTSCVQALRLDSVAVVIARADTLPKGRLDKTLVIRQSTAHLYRLMESANAFQVAIVRIDDPAISIAILRGSGSTGPSIEEILDSVP